LVEEYIHSKDVCRDGEMTWYRRMPSLGEAIRRAALCETSEGKRHPHQRRIPEETLREATRRLAGVRMDRLVDFEELHGLVTRTCQGVRMFGELTRYDVAFRIGLNLRKLPRLVYLHAGTRAGARALGLPSNREFLEMQPLPVELRKLEPWQVEDFLCIYKDQLRPISESPAHRRGA
jgi:hypothetical protein